MKIYYQNRAAKLTWNVKNYSCSRCPFHSKLFCPYRTGTILDCYDQGQWVDGESSKIFKI